MKGRLLLLGAACLLTTSAVAADLPIVEPVYVAPIYDWSGFYVGVNGGYGGGEFKHPFDLCHYYPQIVLDEGEGEGDYNNDCYSEYALSGSADITAGGFVGGIQGGYNWQFDENFLFGIEGDIQGSSIDGRVSINVDSGNDSFDADIGTSLDWFATLRGRAGWVNDRFMVYGTGGVAWGRTTSSVNASYNNVDIFDEIGIDNEVENDRFGWTIGAGVEYALTDNITFKTEYLFTDLGSEEIINFDDYGIDFTADSDVAFHVVRAGINFQF
ncbi:porin family protein [Devosia sp. ZB163]|uniref:outer membrane protein n=1 Tax=Devosia sp. ZB163 TaxID=3025938 RepID=UPI00236088B4|nr:outer membrane protein [Devosia sp. ZB163]MDC9824260.1 porin family protein [Devosia sp. ZB163]